MKERTMRRWAAAGALLLVCRKSPLEYATR